tara:strand:- start:250 stop:702 length:453 start_codon:yes stop_codon:yes gene_type:complete
MVPTAPEELQGHIKAMMRKLSDYQKAARQKDPVKAKAKQRFVTGLRQCMIGTKTGTAKLILLATDTERSQELDAQLSQLITTALSREGKPVPIIFALSRRQLQKACQVNTRQSCVAIYDPQGPGAMEVYRDCVQLFESSSTASSGILDSL